MTTLTLQAQGESLVFFDEADAGAPQLKFEVHLAPGASGPEPHFHPKQSERFAVVSGRMVVKIDGGAQEIGPGEEVLIRPGQVHSFANASPREPLVFRCMAEPALNLQWFLTEMAGAANRSGGRWKDVSLLEAAYILHQIPGEYRLAAMPARLQDVLVGTLAKGAVMLGKAKNIRPLAGRASAR